MIVPLVVVVDGMVGNGGERAGVRKLEWTCKRLVTWNKLKMMTYEALHW
jgi:hypothetical protein